ncbi:MULTISPECIES: hypothetical protein [Citrobacter]|uniref:hypothetical protein n=1 Tax=Citrobacter TaxID=544 RepID=UPI00190090F4|nr:MULTISPECIES: hypothetical protein [Citrobacter]MBJ8957739.1 hypothetical protein [Citrobacter youngae]MBJ9110783.1 hypothetical protein [Citrobacter sp. FDAARGOS_156]MDM2723460.1 hypothetical protein [Citrobacter sp. Cy230]HEF0077871.1 hypothetical protein [Citrobacter youngae]
MKKTIAVGILSVLFSFNALAEDGNPVEEIKGGAEMVCKGHQDEALCEQMVLSLASLAMYNAGYYTQSCLDESKILPKDKKHCENAKALVGYLKGFDNK